MLLSCMVKWTTHLFSFLLKHQGIDTHSTCEVFVVQKYYIYSQYNKKINHILQILPQLFQG